MNRRLINAGLGVVVLLLMFTACKTPSVIEKTANTEMPESYKGSGDSTNSANIIWQDYFEDPHLVSLIDSALVNNQELNIVLLEIAISQNEVEARKGEYLPFVDIGAGAGLDKKARYTPFGASEATTEIEPGREMPDPVQDYKFGAYAHWEVDIWKKLRNAKKSAVKQYLATVEGKNFMVTNLIAEIANSYYELLALDNQLEIVNRNIEIQTNALNIVKIQKEAAKATALAVKKFEAELLSSKSLLFTIQQQIIETENRINFLVGRYPQRVERSTTPIIDLDPNGIKAGIPSQLLENRPDIKQAEFELEAAKLDVKVAKAKFYPSLDITAGIGLQAFDPTYLFKTPESILFSVAGDLMAPLINRRAIKAEYKSANAKQIQAVYDYERTILNAYIEVYNQVSNISNLEQSFDLKNQEVQALTESINISTVLFKSARADYMEVLMTQRDALESKFELIETKLKQMNAKLNVYKALGGGWK
ncbi:TolC family protein [Marinigracilibium pacificum]|uniref:Efflux transporter outer membrane subunit n=1 Tax=Marinigracilibium pacificum TaxID=2729599 RepID=A0A848IX78_9BACT|nr:efflux transporter outer membrane subunit [Marinigracilibium pacificum]NMM47901.1 efflux transporter outer membrane subunit [Marinigracilibium pacificum]